MPLDPSFFSSNSVRIFFAIARGVVITERSEGEFRGESRGEFRGESRGEFRGDE